MRQASTDQTESELLQAPARSWMSELWDWTKSIVIAFIFVLLIHQFGFQLSTVDGSSMLSTLHDGDRLFVNKAIYHFGNPKTGDIVILADPRQTPGQQVYLVKRVVGGPGDTIEIRDHVLYRNGERVEEPYINGPMSMGSYGPEIVPAGHYFVMGDNRNNSTDSRKFGSVPDRLIKGRAEWVVWPFELWGRPS